MKERELFEVWAKVDNILDLSLMPGTDVYENPITSGAWLAWIARSRLQPHCVTCQCARIDPDKPVPKNELSRPWHMNAATTAPKNG